MNLAVYGTKKWISCCSDVMNHIDCVIKRDVYPLKMHLDLCSKNIRGVYIYIHGISRKTIS